MPILWMEKLSQGGKKNHLTNIPPPRHVAAPFLPGHSAFPSVPCTDSHLAMDAFLVQDESLQELRLVLLCCHSEAPMPNSTQDLEHNRFVEVTW